MRVALVHDQLQEFGGAERVLVALHEIYPEADVYTSFYSSEKLGIHAAKFRDWNITTSWAQKVPLFPRLYSPLRFLVPLIWESFNFNEYDVVISSSGWFMCKGVITRPETLHISYLHHPPRALYFYETALEWQKYFFIKIYGTLVNHKLRLWDYLSSQRPDFFIANSKETQGRIKKLYRRDSTVIYPPVNIPVSIDGKQGTQNYYLTVSRLARAKHIDILIKAANEQKFQLKIVGKGRDEEYLKSIAGNTIEFLGEVSDEVRDSLFQNAKAFLFASVDEEFGIAPIEAMGYGLPVIAYSSGGVKETVQPGKNGYLFESLDPSALNEKIAELEKLSAEKYNDMKKNARKSSEQYSLENFKKQIKEFVTHHARTSRS